MVPSAVNASFSGANDTKMGLWDEVDFLMSTLNSSVGGLGCSSVIKKQERGVGENLRRWFLIYMWWAG